MAKKEDLDKELVEIETPHGVFWTRKGDFVNKQLREYGGHQRSELGMILSFAREGDVALDVGAHIGTFSIPLAQHIGPSGHVFSFEPTPESHRILARNISTNGLGERVTAINALISDKKGEYTTHMLGDHTSAAYFTPSEPSEKSSERSDDFTAEAALKTVHLDSWGLEGETKLERLDIMKVDTEGMELRVLESAAGLIERFRPVIMVEVSAAHLARVGDRVEDLEEFLRSFGYNFYFNLGPRHALTEDFELAEIWSPKHPAGLYDLLAAHPDSERRVPPARHPGVTAGSWAFRQARALPSWLKGRMLG
jgi:FkbM family methyltransferase